jgi:N-formylmaleamate deformylase
MVDGLLYGANVNANNIRQHYLRYGGKGRPLILVPGITSPAITWGFVAERLADEFDVYVLDVRGRGLSSTGPNLDYDLDAYAADVLAFAQALDLTDYILVGHSMGARIGIRAASRNDNRLARLVLVDPPVSGPGRRAYPSNLAWYVESIGLAAKGMTIEDMRPFCPTWTDEQLRLRAEWLHTCDEDAIRKTYVGFHEEDIFGDVPKISIPTLLVVASKGGVILPEDVAELKGLLPSLEVAHVSDAGHMIPWDNFDGFFASMQAFLRA